MKVRFGSALFAFALASGLGFGQDEDAKPNIPEDLLDDAHVREELGVNEFTAPSISKLFETLEFLMPLPLMEMERAPDERMPLDRADLAIELGFLIADGFLIVQAGQMDKVEKMATDLTRYGKALGAGDRINRHAAALLESAKKQNVEQLKKELAATQKDVEIELVTLRDADLAHLISLGGWIRALEVSTSTSAADSTMVAVGKSRSCTADISRRLDDDHSASRNGWPACSSQALRSCAMRCACCSIGPRNSKSSRETVVRGPRSTRST
jgi:hypothetical protein